MNDTLYATANLSNQIFKWADSNSTVRQTLLIDIGQQASIFVDFDGNIYYETGTSPSNKIKKWNLNSNVNISVMTIDGRCHGLFVDDYDSIYCSMKDLHQVIKRSLKDPINVTHIVAGNGTAGSSSTMLSAPQGIFVTMNFSLYVADCGNNRIQLFSLDDRNATTVVGGNRSNETIDLNCPTAVVLDGDNNLFITDSLNHRIVSSGPNGYQCIIGCSGTSGSTINQLHELISLSFDSYGNIVVVDFQNRSILKFLLNDVGCCESRPSSVSLIFI